MDIIYIVAVGGCALVVFWLLDRAERRPPPSSRDVEPRDAASRNAASHLTGDKRAPTPRLPPMETRPLDRPPSPAGPAHDRFKDATAHPPLHPTVLRGRAYVVDGDTIRINKTQIRLFGIDAPEMNHPFGSKAKWAMVELCKRQIVTAEVTAIDDHGRTVAKCRLSDGRDLSAELVKQGLAIDWPKYSGGIYRAMETPDARKKLWLADARQKGQMHVWEAYDAREQARTTR